MGSSPLLKNSMFLKREIPDSGGDSDSLSSTDEVLFRDYLKQQIDHLMTGDAGRDGVAEGRRGTHVEVTPPPPAPPYSSSLFPFFQMSVSAYICACTCTPSNSPPPPPPPRGYCLHKSFRLFTIHTFYLVCLLVFAGSFMSFVGTRVTRSV